MTHEETQSPCVQTAAAPEPQAKRLTVEDLHLVWPSIALLTMAGASIGLVDAGFLGLGIGAFCGVWAGLIVGVFLKFLMVCVIGFRTDQRGQPHADKPQVSERLVRGVGWTLFLLWCALMVVICHEVYWLTNGACLYSECSMGYQIRKSTSRGDSREFLLDTLREKRWRLEAFSACPLRWLLQDEVLASNQMTLELCDIVRGKAPTVASPQTWGGRLKNEAVRRLWQSNDRKAKFVTDKMLNVAGSAIERDGVEQWKNCIQRTWIIKYCPEEWTIVEMY